MGPKIFPKARRKRRSRRKFRAALNISLPDGNGNKIPAMLRAGFLKDRLYGCAKDRCTGIKEAQHLFPYEVQLIVVCMYQRDAIQKLVRHIWFSMVCSVV